MSPRGAVAWNDEIELCDDALYLELTGKSAALPSKKHGRTFAKPSPW